MADVTSEQVASSGTGQTPQSPTTSTETSPQSASTSSSSTGSTPASQGATSGQGSKPINLQDSPEFKQWQTKMNKTMEQERQRYQQEMAQLRQQMQQFQLQSVPEDERVVVERDQLRQQLQQFQAEQQRQAQLSQQWNDLDRMAKIAGMKTEDLFGQNFRDIGEAAFYVLESMTAKQKAEFEKSVEAAIAERERKREANTVDLGGGAPVTTDDMKGRRLKEAIARKDSKAFVLEYMQG